MSPLVELGILFSPKTCATWSGEMAQRLEALASLLRGAPEAIMYVSKLDVDTMELGLALFHARIEEAMVEEQDRHEVQLDEKRDAKQSRHIECGAVDPDSGQKCGLAHGHQDAVHISVGDAGSGRHWIGGK
jgi:hypothetical protein